MIEILFLIVIVITIVLITFIIIVRCQQNTSLDILVRGTATAQERQWNTIREHAFSREDMADIFIRLQPGSHNRTLSDDDCERIRNFILLEFHDNWDNIISVDGNVTTLLIRHFTHNYSNVKLIYYHNPVTNNSMYKIEFTTRYPNRLYILYITTSNMWMIRNATDIPFEIQISHDVRHNKYIPARSNTILYTINLVD